MKSLENNIKETILKYLIFAGVLAVALSVHLKYFQPYITDINSEQTDKTSINNLKRMEIYINALQPTDMSQFRLNSNTVFISLPSSDLNCGDIKWLPKIPTGWKYQCASQDNYKKTDGKGWLPINLSDKISDLPAENSGGRYYLFVSDSSSWSLSGSIKSKKILELAANDGGVDDTRFEVGNNPELLGDIEGLVFNWKNNSEISNYEIKSTDVLNNLGKSGTNYTIKACFKSAVSQDQSILEKWSGPYPFALRGPLPDLRFSLYDGQNNAIAFANGKYDDNKRHCVFGVRDSEAKNISIYVDGQLKSLVPDTTDGDVSNTSDIFIGERDQKNQKKFSGFIDQIKIYNRVLSNTELKS